MTCIYDHSNKEIPYFKSMTVNVEYPARLLKAPVETGQLFFDDKETDPMRVSVTGYCELDTIGAVMTPLHYMYSNRQLKLCKVMDDNIVLENLYLENVKHVHDTQNPDLYKIDLVYSEVLMVQESNQKKQSVSYQNSTSTGRVS